MFRNFLNKLLQNHISIRIYIQIFLIPVMYTCNTHFRYHILNTNFHINFKDLHTLYLLLSSYYSLFTSLFFVL